MSKWEDKMAEIIQLDHAKMIQFRDNMLLTNDGKYNQGELMNIIKSMVCTNVGDKQESSEIYRFIIQCFTINGILETYNSLGFEEWKSMIYQMIDHEIYERTAIGN